MLPVIAQGRQSFQFLFRLMKNRCRCRLLPRSPESVAGCRGERIERNFAHRFDTGGLGRLYVRGKENIHKKFLIQAAACTLALLMRSVYGSGKPRAAHDRIVDAILTILALMKAVEDIPTPSSAMFYRERRISRGSDRCH